MTLGDDLSTTRTLIWSSLCFASSRCTLNLYFFITTRRFNISWKLCFESNRRSVVNQRLAIGYSHYIQLDRPWLQSQKCFLHWVFAQFTVDTFSLFNITAVSGLDSFKSTYSVKVNFLLLELCTVLKFITFISRLFSVACYQFLSSKRIVSPYKGGND